MSTQALTGRVPAPARRGPLTWLRTHDPGWLATRGALRAAVVVPVNFAIGSEVVANAQVATFAAFGSFALLIFAQFRGDRRSRAAAFALLGVAGAALITLGTLIATPDWLAVVGMAVVAFTVLFSGVVSSTLNAGTQAALLTFILAVLVPATPEDLGSRLAGWGIAFAVSVPVAMFVWPPVDRNLLRAKAAAMCSALARMLALEQPRPGEGDSLVAMYHASAELRTAFRTSAARLAAVSTGSRLVFRLVDELEWVTPIVVSACADAPAGWPEQGRRLRAAAARALDAAAATLQHRGEGPTPAACKRLTDGIAELAEARTAVSAETLAQLRASTAAAGRQAGEFERPLYAAHELGYAIDLAARTVAAAAAADARPWWQRLLGRQPVPGEAGPLAVAQRVAIGHLDRHSTWLQNSLRGAAGLALAVLLARLVDAQNAFWIGLGALSVVRSNAVSTGATVLRALAGTVVGFAIGGVAVALIGTNHAVLWTLLPFAVLAAASATVVISFVAGQIAFTVFVMILYNIIAPAGWRIGVVRVEDVLLGCAASLIAGLLLWPRGAGAALGAAYADAYRSAAVLLRQVADQVAGHRATVDAATTAHAAGQRLDEALRQYLADRGAKQVPFADIAALANGATRLRLAAVAIAELERRAPAGQIVVPGDPRLDDAAAIFVGRTAQLADWYTRLAAALAGSAAAPGIDAIGTGESFLEVLLPAVEGCGDPTEADRAERLLWSGQYVGDVDRLRGELLVSAGQVAAVRRRPWYRR